MPGAKSTSPGKAGDPGIPWYVIHTCGHHEVRVKERLRQRGLEAFLPQCTRACRRRDHKKLLQISLFPGYLFVQNLLENFTYHNILGFLGVVGIPVNSGRLQPVPQETIESIRLILSIDRPYNPSFCLKKVGTGESGGRAPGRSGGYHCGS